MIPPRCSTRLLTLFAPLFALLLLSVGCSNTERRTFELNIQNNSTKPITVGLAKTGPPYEVEWESPADRAIMDPRNTGIGWGSVILPGKTGSRVVSGEFAPQTKGILRIYIGDLALNDILAIGRDSRNRFDIPLREGKTTFLVIDKGLFQDVIITNYIPGGAEAKRQSSFQSTP